MKPRDEMTPSIDVHIYQDDAVRALAWCIGAPDLMRVVPGMQFSSPNTHLEALAEATPWLRSLDQDPAPLHQHLAVHSSWKVGVYFESLLAFWLAWNPRYTVVGHNLQVRDDTRTLGAFDFLLRNASGQAEHWEVAVKYYLQREVSGDWSAWVGPNQRDRLDIKLARMRDHQLPLSSRAEAESVLSNVGVTSAPRQRAVLKGQLFTHWRTSSERPIGSRAGSPTGQWVETEHFEEYAASFPDHRWVTREKPDWLGPCRCVSVDARTPSAWLQARIDAGVDRPQMTSRLMRLDGNTWIEDGLIFVVSDDWSTRGRP